MCRTLAAGAGPFSRERIKKRTQLTWYEYEVDTVESLRMDYVVMRSLGDR